MIDLKHSLVTEATEDPNFFGFYSRDLEGEGPSCPQSQPQPNRCDPKGA
ncbi:hypothetical protein KAX17_11325 [Candidatus Bipolaricaulota bacterium]|nr:hypothetical protein [Candidatus Bipolaricaulota bacterium]